MSCLRDISHSPLSRAADALFDFAKPPLRAHPPRSRRGGCEQVDIVKLLSLASQLPFAFEKRGVREVSKQKSCSKTPRIGLKVVSYKAKQGLQVLRAVEFSGFSP